MSVIRWEPPALNEKAWAAVRDRIAEWEEPFARLVIQRYLDEVRELESPSS